MELLRWSLPMQGSWIFKIFTKSLLKYSWQLGEMAQAYSPKTSKKGEAEGSQVQGQPEQFCDLALILKQKGKMGKGLGRSDRRSCVQSLVLEEKTKHNWALLQFLIIRVDL